MVGEQSEILNELNRRVLRWSTNVWATMAWKNYPKPADLYFLVNSQVTCQSATYSYSWWSKEVRSQADAQAIKCIWWNQVLLLDHRLYLFDSVGCKGSKWKETGSTKYDTWPSVNLPQNGCGWDRWWVPFVECQGIWQLGSWACQDKFVTS